MKIKSYVALTLTGCVAIALWLWEMPTLATDKDLSTSPENAIQRMVSVRVICNPYSQTSEQYTKCKQNNTLGSVLKKAGNNLVWIQTNNFIISKDGDDINTIENSTNSNILWWIKNQINGWEYNTILWWESNMNKGKASTILGWKGNVIEWWDFSVIVWWYANSETDRNTINWNYSVIVGWTNNEVIWDYSIVLWNNTEVKWWDSVALWRNSKVEADSSFLWTDGGENDNEPRPTLTTNNVFAVYWAHWMVVNATKAHSSAQLTIGGPLVIHKWSDVSCESDPKYEWIVKVVDWESDGQGKNYQCFCSCDGKGYWHSLYGQWRCEWYCNGTNQERSAGCIKKDSTEACYTKTQDGQNIFYRWSCNEYSHPVVWAMAYVMDKSGKLYWTCQTDAWLTVSCSAAKECNN